MPLSLDLRGASRPRQPHEEWVERPLPTIRIDTGAPFSAEALQNLMRLSSSTASTVPRGAPLRGPSNMELAALLPSSGDEESVRRRKALEHETEEARSASFWECTRWLMIGLIVLFVTTVVVMLGLIFGRVNSAMNSVAGETFQDKLDTVMAHAIGAARNSELATQEVVEMARLAHLTADEAQPKIMDALNQSQSMVTGMRSFSMHPTVTLSAG